uniref:Putative secreted protein n=1 Tax=Ixodes ricinus TaxID=34613 RepID=V5HD83_IXORI
MCPELEALSLRWFILLGCSLPVTHSRTVAVKPFQNLRELTLRPRVGRLVHRDACELLLSHCQNIRHIELFCGGGLNDSLALLLCKRNGFPKLRSLRLRHGHALSADGLQSFLSKAFQPRNSGTRGKFNS